MEKFKEEVDVKNELIKKLKREVSEIESLNDKIRLLENTIMDREEESLELRKRIELLTVDKESIIESSNKITGENEQLLDALEEITNSFNAMRPEFERLKTESKLMRSAVT